MKPFITHSGLVLPLDRVNVDTDQMCKAIFEGTDARRLWPNPVLRLALLAGEKPNPNSF